MLMSRRITTRSILSPTITSTTTTINSRRPASTMLTPPPTPKQTRAPGRGQRTLNLDTIHKSILDVEYAVRGELAIKADKYAQMLKHKQGGQGKDEGGMTSRQGESGERGAKQQESAQDDLPFDKVVTANIGNPQQRGLDQKPITFWRQASRRLPGALLRVTRTNASDPCVHHRSSLSSNTRTSSPTH